MHLNKFTVSVKASLLIERRLRRSGTHHRIRRLAEDRAYAAGRHDDGVGGEGLDLHRAQIHGADAAADAVAIEHRRQELPRFVLFNFAFRLVASYLLIERIKELLARSRSR